jgi:hypothetical protein
MIMNIDKVEQDYVNGIPAMNNLIAMIESAIKSAEIPFYRRPRSGGWGYRGFYLVENREFWCGIYFREHLIIVFQIMNIERYNPNYVQEPRWPIQIDKHSIRFRLDLGEIVFFSLNKEEQLELITKFINDSYSDTLKMCKFG